MYKPRNSVFCAALLYSNAKVLTREEQKFLRNILHIIRTDCILNETIHTICVDNSYCRDILTYNRSEICVQSWPVFTIRYPGHKQPKLYSIGFANLVFKEVYDAYFDYMISKGKKVRRIDPPVMTKKQKQKSETYSSYSNTKTDSSYSSESCDCGNKYCETKAVKNKYQTKTSSSSDSRRLREMTYKLNRLIS